MRPHGTQDTASTLGGPAVTRTAAASCTSAIHSTVPSGTADNTIPLPPTRDAVAHLLDIGADIELREFDDVGHEMIAAMNAQFERWLDDALRNEAPDLATRPLDTSVEQDGVDSARCLDAP